MKLLILISKSIILFYLLAYNKLYGQTTKTVQTPGNFQYEGCGCGTVTLNIHNGLYDPYGGQYVPDKITKGAVTVANLNDTDGDTVIDKDDNSVVASSTGRDEVDLMKLEITSTGVYLPQCSTLTLQLHGPIRLWTSPTKGTLANLEIPITELPKTLYIEAYDVSTSIRDLIIDAVIIGDGDVVLMDEVKATAIWTTKEHAYKVRSPLPNPALLSIDNSSMLNVINNIYASIDGSKYGFGTDIKNLTMYSSSTDTYFGGRILFPFTLLPSGIEVELSNLGIFYDITRRKTRDIQYVEYGNPAILSSIISFPNQNEEANDDDEMPPTMGDFLDEDTNPMSNIIFSFDGPSSPAIGSSVGMEYRENLFQEFARVSFGTDIIGNVQEGSRCSSINDWKINFALNSTGSLSSDPYNGSFQKLEMSTGGLRSNIPRRISGTGNGTVVISGISSSSIVSYKCEKISSTDWQFFSHPGSGYVSLGTVSSTSGSWIFTGPTFTATITDGSKKFSIGSVFNFNIWTIPTPLNILDSY